DSSGDDADDEDEDEEDEDKEDEEEKEHLASADSAVVVPTASISLLPEAEVERLLAMPTQPPSPPISLSPPFAGERIARCMAPSAHSSPPPVPSPLLPSFGCLTQIQKLRIASTQALVDAVTPALPSPPLPPSLYIPPPVDRRDDIPESDWLAHKRSCLFALGSRYKVEESSTARPTGGRGIDYGFVKAVPEIKHMTLGEVNTRVTELAELHKHDTQDLYALLEDARDSRTRISQRAYASREALAHSIGLIQAVHHELQTHRDHVYAHETQIQAHQIQLQLQLQDGSHNSQGDNRGNVQLVRPCFYADFMKCQPLNFKGTKGVVGLTKWIEKMESVFNINGCAIENQGEIKKLEIKLWNLKVKGNDVPTYTERFQDLTLMCTKFVANETKKVDKYISGLPDNIYGNVKSARPKTLDETIELANDLMNQKLRTYAERQNDNKRKADDSSGNNHGYFKRDCPKLKNKDRGNGSAQGWVYVVGYTEKKGNASRDPDSNVVTSTFLLNNRYASILFDTSADRSFISSAFSSLINIAQTPLENSYDVELADGKIVGVDTIMRGCTLNFLKPSVQHRSNAGRTGLFRRYYRHGLVKKVSHRDRM
ncbi:hypothetical protein Tco_1381347, partial [Tanacetum coccineum]